MSAAWAADNSVLHDVAPDAHSMRVHMVGALQVHANLQLM